MDVPRSQDEEDLEVDSPNKDRWAQSLVKNVTAVTSAFRGAGDQRHAARRTYLQLAPEARTESYLEVIDEVLYQSTALSRMTRTARMAVARRAHVMEFQPGEALCVRGAAQDCLLVVMSGEVEVVEGRWDGSLVTPPDPHTPRPPNNNNNNDNSPQAGPQPQQPQQPHGPNAGRYYLTEQLSMNAPATPPPNPLQLDSRRHIHPALQSHPSAHRRAQGPQAPQGPGSGSGSPFRPHTAATRPHSRASNRAGRGGGGGGDGGWSASSSPAGADGGGSGGGRVVLHRGDSLGAVDLGWVSRLPRSVFTAAALEDLPSAPSITSRALLATRAEMASGGSLTLGAAPGSGGGFAGWGAVTGSMLRNLGSATPIGAPAEAAVAAAGAGEGGGGAGVEESGSSGDREEWYGGGGGGAAWLAGGGSAGGRGGGADPLQRLRWSCTAVAVRDRVECAAIGLHQLAAVVAAEPNWDVEAMVEALEELPVFAALSGRELRQLVRVLRLHTFAGGTVVYKQGSVGNDLFIIRSGCVRLLKQVALDDNARNRLNRISAELTAVRDQTAAAAALLHHAHANHGYHHAHGAGASASIAPFGSSSGFSPAAGPGGSLSLSSRASTPASLSGSVSTPASPARARRLSQGAGQQPGQGQGTSGGGGGGGGGRFGGAPPGSPHAEGPLPSAIPNTTNSITGLISRGVTSSGYYVNPANLVERTVITPAAPTTVTTTSGPALRSNRSPSGGSVTGITGGSGMPQLPPQLPSPTGSRPVSGPAAPGRLLPDCGPRANGAGAGGGGAGVSYSGGKDQFRPSAAAAAAADASQRRHGVTVAPGSPVSMPSTPQPPRSRNGGAGKQGGGGSSSSSRRQNRWRKRASHATADELLDRFGMVPRAIGEKTEAVFEDVVMPGVGGSAGQYDGGEVPYGTSDSDSGGGAAAAAVSSPASSSHGLPPVGASRSPSMTQLQGGWAAAAAAAVGAGSAAAAPGSPAAVPVWQARQPRQLGLGQEMVFVELGVLTAGQCFGEVRADGVAMRTSSAVCETRTEVLAISRNELHQRMGGRVFEYLWNQVPNDGPQSATDPAVEAGQCAQHLERSMQWTLYKQKLVADVLSAKEQRRRTALKCR